MHLMASSCTKGGLDWILGKISLLEEWSGLEQAANIQSKPPLTQPEAIASCPIAGYLGEETSTCLTTTSFQIHRKK